MLSREFDPTQGGSLYTIVLGWRAFFGLSPSGKPKRPSILQMSARAYAALLTGLLAVIAGSLILTIAICLLGL
jgi:hypothetical protein